MSSSCNNASNLEGLDNNFDENLKDELINDNSIDESNFNKEDNIIENLENDEEQLDNTLEEDPLSGNQEELMENNITGLDNSNMYEVIGDSNGKSTHSKNMNIYQEENEKKKLKMDSNTLLPQEVQDWFDGDYNNLKNTNPSNLIRDDEGIGINTIGQSNKNPTYDIRGNVATPKYDIGPWMNSSIEFDMNTGGLGNC
jgi:hypothetical protein